MPFKLPMIPGFQTYDKEIKMRYPKTPDLDIISGVHVIRSLHVKKENNKSCNSTFNSMLDIYTDRKESQKPTWLVFDKQNLTFDAYFKSTVNESFGCNYNLRKCKIIYFLEDDTIKVVEPVVINSGLPQGCLIKRHKIPLPNSENNDYYQLLDLNVGVTVEFYGKQFKLIGADNFTRDFLKKTGVDVPENLSMPIDPYFMSREKTPNKKQLNAKMTTPKNKKTQGFEGILNFKGYWDDRYNVDGSLHILEVRYFLADDSIQIVEHDLDGCLKTFLKRQKIPKDRIYVKPPGFSEQIDLLNVLGINPMNQWYAFDPQANLSDDQELYYHWSDLHVGAEIDVYSRKIILSNCDEFTKQYYLDYGLDIFPTIDTPKVTEKKEKSNIENVPVCHDENILNKLLNQSNMEALVFKAKFLIKESNNFNREFILKCFLSDQSFSVSETNIQTAGALGCRFFTKRKIPRETPSESNVIFQLYVGAKLCIDNFQFVLIDVEDRTLRFMMNHPNEFPHSHVDYMMNQVLKIIQTDVDTFNIKCFQNKNLIERSTFIEIMSNYSPKLSLHGIFVLALQYKKHEKHREISDSLFRSILQDELKRELFVAFDGLEINFKQRNLDKKDGYLEYSSAFKALKSAKLPFSSEIINMLLDRFTDSKTNKVAYMDLLKYLNYTIDPTLGSQGVSKDAIHRKSDEVYVNVGDLVDDLRKLWR